MVAVGLLAHLCLENEESEALRVAGFFSRIGLPVHLGQLSLSIEQNSRLLDEVIGEALKIFFVHNEPFEVTPEKLKRAMLRAYQLGKEVSRDLGEEAFKRLHHPDNDHRS